jgi:hypothetical protein
MQEQIQEQMTKPRLLAELRDARAEWDALIAEVMLNGGAEPMVKPRAAGVWSVRDLVAHLTSYDNWFVNAMEAQLRGEPPPTDSTEWMDWDERNAIHHQRTLHLSLDEVMTTSRQVYDRLLELVEALSEEFLIQPQQPPGVPQPFVVWEQLRGNTYDHYRLHMVGVRAWLAQRQG